MEHKRLSFAELRNRISIIDIATSVGYRINRKAGIRLPELQLYEGNTKIDEIVIYNSSNSSKQSFFSRNIGDKGNLISFVLNRLNMFSHTSESYEGVNEILNNFLNIDYKQPYNNYIAVSESNNNYSFNINDYQIIHAKHPVLSYLNSERNISNETIEDFISINSVVTIRKKGYSIFNVGFPFVNSKNEITNYEMRNKRNGGEGSFKSFCKGGNKSHSCWIASFCKDNNEVENIYIGESAIDMMSLYELLKLNKTCKCAFVSTGGNPTFNQISFLKNKFPNARLNLCHDNDIHGQIFNVTVSYFYEEINAKGFFNNKENTVDLEINEKKESFNADSFSSFYHIYNPLNVNVVLPKLKDFNEDLKNM